MHRMSDFWGPIFHYFEKWYNLIIFSSFTIFNQFSLLHKAFRIWPHFSYLPIILVHPRSSINFHIPKSSFSTGSPGEFTRIELNVNGWCSGILFIRIFTLPFPSLFPLIMPIDPVAFFHPLPYSLWLNSVPSHSLYADMSKSSSRCYNYLAQDKFWSIAL